MTRNLGRRALLSIAGTVGTAAALPAGGAATSTARRHRGVGTEDADSGRPWTRDPSWATRYETGVRTTGGDDVLVCARDGTLFGLDYDTGETVWSRSNVTDTETSDVVLDTLDGLALVSDWPRVRMFDPATGEDRWTEQVGTVTGYRRAGDRLAVTNQAGEWFVFAVDTGEELHRGSVDGAWTSVIALTDTTLYLVANPRVLALPLSGAGNDWRASDAAYLWGWLDGDVVYAGSEGDEAYALDATTGDVRWSYRVDVDRPDVTYLYPTGDSLFALSNGLVDELDDGTGRRRWRFRRDGTRYIPWPEVVTEARVFVTVGDELYGIDRATGDPVWTDRVAGFDGSVARHGDTVYVAGDEGVTAVGVDGTREWTGTHPAPTDDDPYSVVELGDSSVAVAQHRTLAAWGMNEPPAVSLAVSPDKPTAETPVTVAATVRDEADPADLTYTWTVDGETVEGGQSIERRFEPGTHSVGVTVVDPAGESGTAKRQFEVVRSTPTPTSTGTPSPDAASTDDSSGAAPGFGLTGGALALGSVAAWLRGRRD